MYVGIYGYSNAEFSLKVRWSEPGDAPAEENSRASIKTEGGVEAEISAVSIQSMNSVSSSAPQVLGSSYVVEVMQMTWQGLCQWLQALDIDEGVRRLFILFHAGIRIIGQHTVISIDEVGLLVVAKSDVVIIEDVKLCTTTRLNYSLETIALRSNRRTKNRAPSTIWGWIL